MKRTEEQAPPTGCKRSICPVSCALDIVGDKWTLLVVRDLFMGKSTYGELQKSPENIPTNILAERLKRLEKTGIVRREPYHQRPVRYAYVLTDKGKGLGGILKAMANWGNHYIPDTFVLDNLDEFSSSAGT